MGVSFFSYGQEVVIKGIVQDSLQQPVASAIVTLKSHKNPIQILSFATTSSNGHFQLTTTSTYRDSLFMTISHMAYADKKIPIGDYSKQLTFTLDERKERLQEVLVNAKRNIDIKGDTIKYTVEALKQEKDYTIEEVIDRIPGVSIAENGQISYKEKPLSHLYINGVDLLEGRYNIATRGIPAAAVEDIEVLQRHNHARIDIGRTASGEVAMNLNIKEDQSLVFGSAKADAGFPFLTALGEATPILLKDEFQNIASFRLNNIGNSLINYGIGLTRGNINLDQLASGESQILSEPQLGGSVLSNKFWLDNESASITNDALITVQSNEVVYKATADYNYEDAQIERESNNVFFFNNDSTVVNNRSLNRVIKRRLQGGLVAEVNKDNFYLKNKLAFFTKNHDGISENVQNTLAFNSDYTNNSTALRNSLEMKNPLGNKVISSGLIIEYIDNDEILTVDPAVFTDVIPTQETPQITRQKVDNHSFNVAAYSKLDFTFLKSDWELKQDVQYKRENLSSSLFQNEESFQSFPFKSTYALTTIAGSTSLKAKYKWKNWNISLQPSIQLIDLKQERDEYTISSRDSYIFLNPRASANYSISNRWNTGALVSRDLTVSSFNQLYDGLILKSFDRLFRNPTDVNVTRNGSGTIYLNYDNILKGFYLRNNITYLKSSSDFTFASSIDQNGLLQIDALERDNEVTDFTFDTRLSKRLFKYLSTEIAYTFKLTTSEQFFNDLFQENRNTSHNISLELSWNKESWYSLNYLGSINFMNSSTDSFIATSLFQKHDMELDLYLTDMTRWNFSSESVISSFSSSDNTNFNTLFRSSFFYKPSKKIFLRASINNIFNQRFFSTSGSSANSISLSRFNLRPRQFTVGLNYTL